MKFLGRYGQKVATDIIFPDQVIWCYNIDKQYFHQEILPKSSRLREQIKKHKAGYPPVTNLAMDLFFLINKLYPVLTPENAIKNECVLNYVAIKKLTTLQSFQQTKASCYGDELLSIMAAEIYLEEATNIINNVKEEHDKLQEEIKKLKQQLEEGEEDGEKVPHPGITMEEAQKKLDEAEEELQKLYKEKVERKLVKSADIAFNEISQVSSDMIMWGLGNDGNFQRMPYEEKMGLIDKLKNSKKLKKIAILLGKMKELYFKGKEETPRKAQSNLKDVELGNTISKLLPSELTKFACKRTRRMFYKDFQARKLLQHNYGTKRTLGMGPIVALIDCSGSMDGDNEIYAKAVCLTLLEIAKNQKRAFLAVHFDSGTDPDDLHTNRFEKDKLYDIKNIIDLAEYFGGGGTEFEPPLKRAAHEINTHRDFLKADIVMLTDGCAPLSDKYLKTFLKWKEEKKIKLFSVLIDSGWTNTETLDKFSDSVATIDDVTAEKGMSTADRIFRSLL